MYRCECFHAYRRHAEQRCPLNRASGAARLGLEDIHKLGGRRANNRAETSHPPIRRRERKMRSSSRNSQRRIFSPLTQRSTTPSTPSLTSSAGRTPVASAARQLLSGRMLQPQANCGGGGAFWQQGFSRDKARSGSRCTRGPLRPARRWSGRDSPINHSNEPDHGPAQRDSDDLR